MEPNWLRWGKELQAIAQIGLTYAAEDSYDRQRYARIRELAAEILAAGGDMGVDTLLSLFEREEGYATPKVDVRGVVFADDKLLLVKEVADGGWTLPGGWADVNDAPSEAVVREIREESGFEARAVKLLAVFDRSKHGHAPAYPFHIYKLFILCEIIGGQATTSHETSGVGFFGSDEVPDLSVSRVTPAQIARMFEHHRHPDLPTDFD